MAGETVQGTPYIHLSNAMRAFYARRGMWRDDAPAGLLATWLREPVPWKVVAGSVGYWTTFEGLRAMRDDAESVPLQAWQTYHQRAQFLRRLREAAIRAGEAVTRDEDAPGAMAAAAPAAKSAAEPFQPLRIPPSGTWARAAFERHVMTTLREFVDFTQGMEYMEQSP